MSYACKALRVVLNICQTSFLALQNLEDALQHSADSIMEQVGPLVAQALMYNISGHAARSELDKVCEPLRKLVVKQVKAKMWLEAALRQVQSLGNSPQEAEKRVFLQKVVKSGLPITSTIVTESNDCSLRGSKQTNPVVKDYWLTCRGSNFAYVS